MKKTAKCFAVSFATPSLNLFLRNSPAMVSELPARLSHLSWWRRTGWTGMAASGSLKGVPTLPPSPPQPNFHPNFLARPQFGHQLLSTRCLFLAWPSCQCQLDCTSTSCLFLAKGTKEFLNLDSAWKMLGVDENYTFIHVSHFYVKSPCQSL